MIEPAQLKVLATYPTFTLQDQAKCPTGAGGHSLATISPNLALVARGCPFVVHVLNLDTGAISCTGLPGCDSSGTVLNAGFVVSALASGADGTQAFLSDNFSNVALLNFTQNRLATSTGPPSQGQNVAVNADGTLFASNLAVYDHQLFPVNLMSGVGYFSTTSEGIGGGGPDVNPSGSLLYQPSYTLDIFDVHRGRLALRFALPELHVVAHPLSLAVDETGSQVFMLSSSGITIVQIAQLPLSIGSLKPNPGGNGTAVTIRSSGFQSGAQVFFGTAAASTTTFVDAMTLTVVVPNLPSGPAQVTVSNPDGGRYSLDAAFFVNSSAC